MVIGILLNCVILRIPMMLRDHEELLLLIFVIEKFLLIKNG
jgi:hypothetical protein